MVFILLVGTGCFHEAVSDGGGLTMITLPLFSLIDHPDRKLCDFTR